MCRVERGGIRRALLPLPRGKQALELLADRLDFVEVHRARRPLEAVRRAKHDFDQWLLRRGVRIFFETHQSGGDGLQVLRRLDLEGRAQLLQEFLVGRAHRQLTV